jgi:hypothetical protein
MLHLFLACQGFVVLFIALHDWIPLGSLTYYSSGGFALRDVIVVVLVVSLSFLTYSGEAFVKHR